jgi:hypothetical protein
MVSTAIVSRNALDSEILELHQEPRGGYLESVSLHGGSRTNGIPTINEFFRGFPGVPWLRLSVGPLLFDRWGPRESCVGSVLIRGQVCFRVWFSGRPGFSSSNRQIQARRPLLGIRRRSRRLCRAGPPDARTLSYRVCQPWAGATSTFDWRVGQRAPAGRERAR